MKTLVMAFTLFAAMSIMGSTSSFAQTKDTRQATDLTQALTTTTVQNGLINVGGVPITVGNITVQDLVTVQSVLNNAQIDVLNNSLNNNTVLKTVTVDLTNVLRDAKILNQNQVIVGILSDQSGTKFVTQNVRSAAAKK